MTTQDHISRASSSVSRRAKDVAGVATLRVLMVEDSADDALFMLRELKRGGYKVLHERVDTAEGMKAALEKQVWDVVVSDHAMPSFSAPAALELLKENGWLDLPFIIVSGHIGEDAAVRAMKAGAHDFIAKDSLARLVPAIERALRDAEERRQRRQVQDALRLAEEKYRGIFENAVEGIFQTTAGGKLVTANPMMARIFGYESPEEMIEAIRDLKEQLYVEPMRRAEFVRRMRQDGRVLDFETQFYRKDGAVIWTSTNARAVRGDSGEIVGFEGSVEDITDRKRAESKLRRSLDRLVALHEAGSLLGSTLEPEEIATRLLEIMRRISGLTAAVISLHKAGHLHVWRSVGLENLKPKTRYSPEVREAQEDVMKSEKSRAFLLDDRRDGEGESTAGLCMPLRVRERTIGVLEAYGPEVLAERDTVEILENLTNQAASAFENAQLYGELAKREKRLQELVGKVLVAQEEERRRVSYDVHDGLAQVAAAAYQHLQVFAQYNTPSSEEGREDLERVSGLVRQTVGEARRIIANLRPTALDDFGLKSAVRLHLDTLRADGWDISYKADIGNERLPAVTETAIFRVIQEALNNVGKHAGSRRVDLSLERLPVGPLAPGERPRIRLTVRDYGRGFVVESPENRGAPSGPGERVGMTGMRERIALLGGDFRVASRPGEGTLVVAEVPLLEGPVGGIAEDVTGQAADHFVSDPFGDGLE